MTVRARDSQRSRFFKAKKAAGISRYATPLPEIADVTKYLRSVQKKATLVRRYQQEMKYKVTVRDGRGYSRAASEPTKSIMDFPKTSRTTYSVLCQYAFIIAYNRNPKGAWYGWEYCGILLDLVRFMIGPKAGDDLRIAFENEGVRYTAPAKKVLTPEQKAAMVTKGQKLAALNRDRKARARFGTEYPEAPWVSRDEFGGDWEDLYLLWRP
jgi:hypothetical protein